LKILPKALFLCAVFLVSGVPVLLHAEDKNPELQALIEVLNKPQPYDARNARLSCEVENGVYILANLLGRDCHVKAIFRKKKDPVYHVYLSRQSLYGRIFERGANIHVTEDANGVITVRFFTRRYKISFMPRKQDIYIAKIHK